jgi:hypothetical protein
MDWLVPIAKTMLTALLATPVGSRGRYYALAPSNVSTPPLSPCVLEELIENFKKRSPGLG